MSEVNLPLLELRDYQKPIWNHMMQDIPGLRGVHVWPRRNGKDITDINILAAKALQRKGDYAYVAPFANQCRGIIWEGNAGTGMRFRDYIPREIITRTLDQSMKLWLSNGSTIQLYGSDNPDALVGRNFVGIIFTEFSLHKDAIWGYLRPMLAENGGWAMFNGTPRGMNHFYIMAEMARKNPKWFYEKLTCVDTGYPTLEEIQEEREAGMPESLIQQEFYTSWSASSEETLIPLEKLKICQRLSLQLSDFSFAPRIMGVDPAYAENGDLAAIAKRQGRKVHPLWTKQGIDPMALASTVAQKIDEWRAHYCFIDAGRGEAIWSRLYQLGYQARVIPVHFDGKVYSDLYHRKKDEMWGRMKNHLCHPDMPVDIPDDDSDLIRDLSAPTFEINDRGKLQIEGKKSLKSRGFRSTDRGDALALTYAEELDETEIVTPRMKQLGITEDVLRSLKDKSHPKDMEYDPLNYMDQYIKQAESFF